MLRGLLRAPSDLVAQGINDAFDSRFRGAAEYLPDLFVCEMIAQKRDDVGPWLPAAYYIPAWQPFIQRSAVGKLHKHAQLIAVYCRFHGNLCPDTFLGGSKLSERERNVSPPPDTMVSGTSPNL